MNNKESNSSTMLQFAGLSLIRHAYFLIVSSTSLELA
jgi:hypothetical protein